MPVADPLPTVARGVFVTGTDTEVGKTLASCALIHALRSTGLTVAAMKPVATGDIAEAEDALALQQASGLDLPLKRINSFLYAPAIAPHLAAAQAHRKIEMRRIQRDYGYLTERAQCVVVEGVGGWMVPLGPRLMLADIPQRLNLPVVLVVGLRLGCLNHALLSARAIADDGLELRGWIGSAVDPAMASRNDNIEALKRRLPAPCLGIIPPLAGRDRAQQAVKHLRTRGLEQTLWPNTKGPA